jgi:hypothetical protein
MAALVLGFGEHKKPTVTDEYLSCFNDLRAGLQLGGDFEFLPRRLR